MIAAKPIPIHLHRGALACLLWLTAQAAMAIPSTLTVNVATTELSPGPGFHFEFSIKNFGPEDVVTVDLLNAPDDPLIDATLTAPPGFVADYDPGVLRVIFIGDTSLFDTGTTRAGFSFDSALAVPGQHFNRFEALNINGELTEGAVGVGGAVPDTGRTFQLAGIGLVALAFIRRITVSNQNS